MYVYFRRSGAGHGAGPDLCQLKSEILDLSGLYQASRSPSHRPDSRGVGIDEISLLVPPLLRGARGDLASDVNDISQGFSALIDSFTKGSALSKAVFHRIENCYILCDRAID
ncbi:MAG: hypothetical protein JGK26_06545 [Microcoleus sp. PH2017_27_LUM_O_A]|uniref:hypothetical protein n=1 Tax=Microcoleus sp. PH2017_22_RUC_O_B TaxID=2798833 RepID=UPI001D575BB9|nr:hypothetical protein [Microcoleus sp. PH2017_22_RUC_O_B]MCC3458988.1 hypothetical protein [Microcoleus sp. PH2017_11_PCY_U_A]MCC3558789.1 hypothetical protein [Microcoleus sp. PH2017_27_LUM_O_A]